MDRQGESLCLGANEEEVSGNPSGLAATILRAAFRSRIYVSNRETYPALNKALQKGGVHIRPHMIVPSIAFNPRAKASGTTRYNCYFALQSHVIVLSGLVLECGVCCRLRFGRLSPCVRVRTPFCPKRRARQCSRPAPQCGYKARCRRGPHR